MATGKPCKNTISALVAHIWKTNSVTPIFLLHKSDQQATMKLSAKFSTFNFAKIFILACWLHFRNEKWGSPSSFLRCEQLKPKYEMFLQGFPVAMVTFYVTKMNESLLYTYWDLPTEKARNKIGSQAGLRTQQPIKWCVSLFPRVRKTIRPIRCRVSCFLTCEP